MVIAKAVYGSKLSSVVPHAPHDLPCAVSVHRLGSHGHRDTDRHTEYEVGIMLFGLFVIPLYGATRYASGFSKRAHWVRGYEG